MPKLNLGCGHHKLPGWINIDSVKEFEPDLVHDLSDPLPYADLSAEEILAQDLLEHFDKYARYFFCLELARVLKIGGSITIQVPNFRLLMWQFIGRNFNDFVDDLFAENMLASKVYIGHFGNHKFGYSISSLKRFLSIFGIEAQRVEKSGTNIRYTGKKQKHVTFADLQDIQVYSYGNDHGVGEAFLPLSVIKEKITQYRKKSDILAPA
jgi:predicted SAM-dependent methyltransferase